MRTRLSLLRAAGAGALALLARPLGARATTTGPRLRGLRVGGAGTWAGDSDRLATVSAGRRDERAVLRFALDKPASVTVEAVATGRRTERTVWSRTRSLQPGEHVFDWRPPRTAEARTYLLRTTVLGDDGEMTVYGERHGLAAPIVRVLGIDAAWVRRSYQPRQRARLRIETDAEELTLQLFRNGPEPVSTNRADELSGIPVSAPVKLDWRQRRGRRNAALVWIGDWPSGFYYARLVAEDGRVGFAPFVLRPAQLGASRVAVVLPTNTWQAYNFRDADGDGWGDTWYAGGSPPVVLDRPYLQRGVPPRFKQHDRAFLRWLALTRPRGRRPRRRRPRADRDRRAPPHAVRPRPLPRPHRVRHRAYVRRCRAVPRPRRQPPLPLREQLLLEGREAGTRDAAHRPVAHARPTGGSATRNPVSGERRRSAAEAVRRAPQQSSAVALGRDRSRRRRDVRRVRRRLRDGDRRAHRYSPPGTTVVAEIPNLFGRGYTAQMTYYETAAGARVFAAGALDFGGAVMHWPMRRILQNVWNRLAPVESALTHDQP